MNSTMLSSIGRKLAIALAGLFLMTFLVVHLGINLLLIKDDGGASFRAAADFMAHNPVIQIFEIVLFLGFALHILIGIILWIGNMLARGKGYKISNQSETTFFSKYMFHTGMIVLAFLILHFFNFYFVKEGWISPPEGIAHDDLYQMALLLFQNPVYSILYLLAFIFLGFHLNHAFQSAFQTLGLEHTRYSRFIRGFGTFYALVVSVGFAIIPLYFLFLY
ncbi:MAG: succinate dehydrogenase cytochrome b subunit [Bacteroidales bacterium]